MPRYTVTLVYYIPCYATTHVDAANEEEAGDKALTLDREGVLCFDPEFSGSDDAETTVDQVEEYCGPV